MTKLNVTLSDQMSEMIEDNVRRQGISREEALKRIFALYKIADAEQQKGRKIAVVEDQDGELKICGLVTSF